MAETNSGEHPVITRPVRRYLGAEGQEAEEPVVEEQPLTVYVNGEELATLVCSPFALEYMAVGFLCAEGILKERRDLKEVEIDSRQGVARVTTADGSQGLAGKIFLKRYITPCCGRARASFYFATDALLCHKVESELTVEATTCQRLSRELQERSRLFQKTGGVHNAALVGEGRIIIFQEDIGRHNTLDKILGECFLKEIPRGDKLIVFSGRVSSEIVLKIVKMGIPLIVSRSAPTNLAVELAEDLGVTIVGFTRENRCTVYSHLERVV